MKKRFEYKIDFLVIFMLLGVLMDVISTFITIKFNFGVETNPILNKLIGISLLSIPIYLMARVPFIPLLSEVLRKSFSFYFGVGGFLIGINNLSLILYDNPFIMSKMGIWEYEISMTIIGLIGFIYFVYKNNLKKNQIISSVFKGFLFILFLLAIEGIFYLVSILF